MITPSELTEKIHRVKFRRWTELEDYREQFIQAAESNAEDFPKKFNAYLSAALEVKEDIIAGLSWIECVELFYAIYDKNLPVSTLPLVSSVTKDKKPVKIEWDYPGRTWYLYAHMLAQAYGWTLEYIAELEIDDALALVQEILTDEQLEKEFQWGMSEIAYPYNEKTKQSRYQPLPRPHWMLPSAKEIKKVKIPRSMMPQGLILDAGTGKPTIY